MQPVDLPAPETPSTHTGLRHTGKDLELRCRILEIELRTALSKNEEYLKLLEEQHNGHAAAAEPPAIPPDASRVSESVRRDDTEPETERAFVGIIARLCARNGTNTRTAIFRAAGLRDRKLEREEAACARGSPDISWMAFCKLFGGVLLSERPTGNRVPGYESDTAHFLCTNSVAQPFAPMCIGGPGVILSSPGASLLSRFHVFIDPSRDGRRTKLRYCGIYTTAHAPMEVQIDEWHGLPTQCTRRLLMGLQRSKVRDVHARCTLRKRRGFVSDPSPAEILEWSQQYRLRSEVLERGAIREAFDSGVEKYCFEAINCIGYDMKLARIIQDCTAAS